MMYNDIAFYVVAHADDWQLFRGEAAYADVRTAGRKVVFIHTSAGDAGRTDGWWESRESAALQSMRACVPTPSPLTERIQIVAGHPVQRYECANTVLYFLRLPDGNLDGYGFVTTGSNPSERSPRGQLRGRRVCRSCPARPSASRATSTPRARPSHRRWSTPSAAA